MFNYNKSKNNDNKNYKPPAKCGDCTHFDDGYCYKLNHYVESNYKACRCAEWDDDDYEDLFM